MTSLSLESDDYAPRFRGMSPRYGWGCGAHTGMPLPSNHWESTDRMMGGQPHARERASPDPLRLAALTTAQRGGASGSGAGIPARIPGPGARERRA